MYAALVFLSSVWVICRNLAWLFLWCANISHLLVLPFFTALSFKNTILMLSPRRKSAWASVVNIFQTLKEKIYSESFSSYCSPKLSALNALASPLALLLFERLPRRSLFISSSIALLFWDVILLMLCARRVATASWNLCLAVSQIFILLQGPYNRGSSICFAIWLMNWPLGSKDWSISRQTISKPWNQ